MRIAPRLLQRLTRLRERPSERAHLGETPSETLHPDEASNNGSSLDGTFGHSTRLSEGLGDISPFVHDGERPETGGPATEIEALFWTYEGPLIHKWHHYLPIYDRYLSPWRGTRVRMLEIGVSRGGSLELWRRFLGPDAVIFGVDIDPNCARFDGQAAQVRIGSQDDSAFLRKVVAEMGGVDIVLDDGSHVSEHVLSSLDTLYPILADGGIYLIEDLHTSYWRDFEGGYREPASSIEAIKTIIDDMHHWYHTQGQKVAATADYVSAMHIYDSIAVLEKTKVIPPRHSRRGTE